MCALYGVGVCVCVRASYGMGSSWFPDVWNTIKRVQESMGEILGFSVRVRVRVWESIGMSMRV